MCLAVPGKIVECEGDEATVAFEGNRLRVSRVLTPKAGPGDWVLVHAGFAISTIPESSAMETWDYLKACYSGNEVEFVEAVEQTETARSDEQ